MKKLKNISLMLKTVSTTVYRLIFEIILKSQLIQMNTCALVKKIIYRTTVIKEKL